MWDRCELSTISIISLAVFTCSAHFSTFTVSLSICAAPLSICTVLSRTVPDMLPGALLATLTGNKPATPIMRVFTLTYSSILFFSGVVISGKVGSDDISYSIDVSSEGLSILANLKMFILFFSQRWLTSSLNNLNYRYWPFTLSCQAHIYWLNVVICLQGWAYLESQYLPIRYAYFIALLGLFQFCLVQLSTFLGMVIHTNEFVNTVAKKLNLTLSNTITLKFNRAPFPQVFTANIARVRITLT